jgi:hypothetical protein
MERLNEQDIKGGTMKDRRRPSALLLAGVTAGTVIAAAHPAQAASDLITIQNAGNVLCLQPNPPGSTDDGAPIFQVQCASTSAQTWIPVLDSDGHYRFVNQNTGKCLDARGGASNGTPVQQWTCNTISNEKWSWLRGAGANGSDRFRSAVSGTNSHCLDVPNATTQPNTAVQIWSCNGTSAQDWFTFHP